MHGYSSICRSLYLLLLLWIDICGFVGQKVRVDQVNCRYDLDMISQIEREVEYRYDGIGEAKEWESMVMRGRDGRALTSG